MESVLLTGASGFLGYHVARKLNELGIRPRVLELRESPPAVPTGIQVERCAGTLEDPDAVRSACFGVGTLMHLAFKVSVGGGAKLAADMKRINVAGTRLLLETAEACGVKRAVVAGSSLAVGVNRKPEPLDETASWSEHAFDLQYAHIRREAELMALSRATPQFAVTTVCPAFTFGPDDPVGAPANKLVKAIIDRKFPCLLPVGFGALDVRDFASGVVLAAERGRSGERYLLSGENMTVNELVEQAASLAGVRAPRFTAPTFLVHALVGGIGLVSSIRGKPAPVTRDVLQIIGRYAWYDTSKARAELGWSSRPARETLADTIRWLRNPVSSAATPQAHERGAGV